MEPTSSSDNARPTPGPARFWQVRPDADPEVGTDRSPAAGEPETQMVSLGSRRVAEPPEQALPPLPTDLLTGSSLAFGPRPGPPFTPVASASRPHGPGEPDRFSGAPGEPPPGDPFGLRRAAGRGASPTGGDQGVRPPARGRHGDSDHSIPADREARPGQDVESQEPEAASPVPEPPFGGFRLGGTGRFLFGGRAAPRPHPGVNGHATAAETSAADTTGVAGPGDAQVAGPPADEEPTGATPAGEPADATSPEAGQDAAEAAEPRDENGREDMNGRAGAPGYAQAGDPPGPDEAPAADGPPDEADEAAAEARPAAGWASVPAQPTGPTGPVSGAPVSPGYAPAPYLPTDFTPDHPAATLEPAPGRPEQAPEQPADPAGSAAPVSPAQPAAPATGSAAIPAPPAGAGPELPFPAMPSAVGQIPATRMPSDPPPAPDTGFAFGSPATTGYSLGRSGDAYGVASVTPAAPQAASVTPPPLDFQPYPESGLTGVSVGNTGRRGLPEEEQRTAGRRSASLEDAEPARP
ncbi:hypothetical protein, partial [Actinoplanes teichomyceticus]|uniref:hypothetical protein n=1 Tax=Actinoplanes teichomyceticus TaxID=1867 RepID=UPI0037098620